MSEFPLRAPDGSGGAGKADPLQPQLCAKLLAALAAPERLRIVRFLRDGPRNVGEIAELLQIPMVNASHHLSVLKVAGLVRGEKRGRFVHYSITPGVLQLDDSNSSLDDLNLGCCSLRAPLKPEDDAKP